MPDAKPIRSYADVPGWFRWLDKTMFDTLLKAQGDQPPGDIVELGAYLGKSAVVLGDHVRDGERLVVVDLFGTDPSEYEPERPEHDANRRENTASYGSLERGKFEANYLALHAELPVVVTGPSGCIVEHVASHSARFVHVDAGHLYENVREDVANTRTLLRPNGVAVFDDWRAEHTPGVTAAVWEAVVNDGLVPFALNTHKLYGTYGDGSAYAKALRQLFDVDDRYWYEEQQIMGHPVIRVRLASPPTPPASPPAATLPDLRAVADDIVARVVAQTRDEMAEIADRSRSRKPGNRGQRPSVTPGSKVRRRAKELIPPTLRRSIARRRTR